MTYLDIKRLFNRLSEEDKEDVENAVWFLKENCLGIFDYVYSALDLVELINKLKEKYEKSN